LSKAHISIGSRTYVCTCVETLEELPYVATTRTLIAKPTTAAPSTTTLRALKSQLANALAVYQLYIATAQELIWGVAAVATHPPQKRGTDDTL